MAWCGFRLPRKVSTTVPKTETGDRGTPLWIRGRAAAVMLTVLFATIAFSFGGLTLAAGGLAHSPLAGETHGWTGPGVAPATPTSDLRPAANGSAPPSWYCPGGAAKQTTSASQRFDFCTFVQSRGSTENVLYYVNATDLGTTNVTGSYLWDFWFGDGGTANVTTASNLTGNYLHDYSANGTYSFEAAVSDSLGSLNLTIPITVSLNVSAMSVALSSYETLAGNGTETTAFSCAISGGVPNYDFQYSFGDGSYYLNNTSASTGSCATTHTYGPVASPTSYTVSVRAWDASGHNASASLSVTPSYNYNNSSTGGSGGSPCGGVFASGPNSTAGSLTTRYASTATLQAWYGHAWTPSMNLTWNATLYVGNSSATVDMGGTAFSSSSPGCLSGSWGDGTLLANWSVPASGASGFSLTHSYNRSGAYRVTLAISNGTAGALANFSFALNFTGSTSRGGTNNSSSGSLVSQLVSSSTHDVWLVQVWVPGDYLNTTANLTISSTSALMTLDSSLVASRPPWYVSGFFSPGSAWSMNGTVTGSFYGATVTHAYNASGIYWSTETLRQGNATAAANVTFALNFTTGTSGGNTSYPTNVSVTVGAAPVTGAAPLTVVLSAFIDGGSAPFAVVWSLPGSGTTNATGLMVTATYNLSGWYPATAFVYNTTSAYGTVLVGYGSVWLYATGNSTGSGSGGGNSSGNHSGDTPIPGATTAGGAPPPAMSLTLALLVAVATGGVAGGVAGFAVGQHQNTGRRRPPRPAPADAVPRQ